MKKFLSLLSTLLLAIALVGCDKIPKEQKQDPPVTFTVTFDSQGGSTVPSQTVESGKTATEPAEPTKDGFTFEYWYVTDDTVEYVFSTPVTANLILKALWNEVVISEKTPEELIQEDIEAIQASLMLSRYEVNTVKEGPVNGSRITWISNSDYVTRTGVVLPLLPGHEGAQGSIRGRFSLNGKIVNHDFVIPLSGPDPVVIAEKRTIPFTNLTTEYDVADKNVDIFYEQNGSVPYVKVSDFLSLLQGFIDPVYELTFETVGNVLTVAYDYLDEDIHAEYLAGPQGPEDFDGWYHLTMVVDADNNTITTLDPGFYWAYVYSTKTNYGRHINYDRKNPDIIYVEGEDLVYDLNKYNMDIVVYEGEVLLPYFVANQLLAGVSYYNVYYNYDGLFGVYAIPNYGDDVYTTIKTSSTNEQPIPTDLMIHTFNYLGFAFDEFYGLKDVMEVDSYYNIFLQHKNNLLNSKASVFDDELFNFIMKDIDEPHTSFRYPGFYNKADYIGPRLTSLSQMGPRVLSFYEDGLYAVDDAIAAKWGLDDASGWAADLRPKFWFLDIVKEKGVLALDEFNTSDIQESLTYDPSLVNDVLEVTVDAIPAIPGGNKYFFYNNSTQEYKLVEVLVKGLESMFLDGYLLELEQMGFVLNKVKGVYEKTVGEKLYLARAEYDKHFGLFASSILVIDANSTEVENPHEEFAGSIEDLVNNDTAVYMEMYLELMTNEAPLLNTVLLDLTFNTGGNVGALYRVVGFITDQPFAISSIDGATNSRSRSYVYIDGVPKYNHFKWGVLTSGATFSAANSLATIFQQNNLGPVIGMQSGGGASSITPILLPNGTAFTMSSNSIGAYVTGTGAENDPYVFHSNEFGIEPDFPLTLNVIYDADTLLEILNSLT